MYQLHGGSFVSPSLGSSLYLLMIRLTQRDFHRACMLVDAIGTDTRFTAEERQIFDLIGEGWTRPRPDFYAVRAHRAALADADEPATRDMRTDQAEYTARLAHVSASCRLSEEDERRLIDGCHVRPTAAHRARHHEAAAGRPEQAGREPRAEFKAKKIYATDRAIEYMKRFVLERGRIDMSKMQRRCLTIGERSCVRSCPIVSGIPSSTR